MKTQDLALSVMLHAGLLAGVVCGVYVFGNDPEEDVPVEPFFFEVLEESAIAESSVRSEGNESGETRELPAPSEPGPGKSEPENPVPEDPMPESPVPDGILPAMEVEKDEPAEVFPERNLEFVPDPESKREVPPDPKPKQEVPPPDAEQKQVSIPDSGPEVSDRENAELVSTPEAAGKIVPRYPRSARRRGREGSVTVEVSVSDSGKVIGAEVVVSSGHDDLDAAAVSAVRSARFHPATENGVSVTGMLRLTFEFKLR